MIEGPEVQRTDEGLPWCPVAPARGRLIGVSTEEFRLICEARYILDHPRDQMERHGLVARIARKRARTDAEIADVETRLKGAAMEEWHWRQEQAAKAEGGEAA